MSKPFWPLAALSLVFLAGGFVAATYWRKHTESSAEISLAAGTLIRPARDLGNFFLLDQDGKPFGPERLHGAWSLLYFGYTNCPDVCPATLATLAAVDKQLRGAAPVDAPALPDTSASGVAGASSRAPQVYFVSVDAHRDTPAQLARYVRYFDPGFRGVTAPDQATIESFARKLGVAILISPVSNGIYTVDHSSAIFLISPDGKLDAVFTGPFRAETLASDIGRLMAPSG